MSTTFNPATLADLARARGKAELIDGRIVEYMPSGKLHARVSKRLLISLEGHVAEEGDGEAFGDNLGYALPATLVSGRQSFCPNVSYYDGPEQDNPLGFVMGPPTLAIEVRSQFDYGRSAEASLAEKRHDYFEAGTLVVWDVDPEAKTITAYRAATPDVPQVFALGQVADAEPAVAGWRVNLSALFENL